MLHISILCTVDEAVFIRLKSQSPAQWATCVFSQCACQCGDGFKNRPANFPGRAWTTRGVANLARFGHNRGSTKLSTPSPSLAQRQPYRGFLMGTLGRAQAKKCHTYSAHHSSRADIFWRTEMSKVQRTSPGEMSGVESGATGNLWEDVPVPQGTYQGGSRRYHRFPAADCPASGQWQCIAGGATQQQQQQQSCGWCPWPCITSSVGPQGTLGMCIRDHWRHLPWICANFIG